MKTLALKIGGLSIVLAGLAVFLVLSDHGKVYGAELTSTSFANHHRKHRHHRGHHHSMKRGSTKYGNRPYKQ